MKMLLLGFVLLSGAVVALPGNTSLLDAGKPLELVGTQGKFDFIKIDAVRRRLLACHTGNGSLDVIDIDSAKLIKRRVLW